MSGGGGGKNQTTTSTNEPWRYAAPYLLDVMQRARANVADQPQTYYPGQTYADQSPATLASQDLTAARALYGSPLESAGQDAMMASLRGDYLAQGNPYLQAAASGLGDAVQEQVGSRFAAAGRRYGGVGEQESFQRTLANSLAPMQMQSFENERNRMSEASRLAPIVAQQDYGNLDRLAQVGRQQEAFQQQGINEAIARHEFDQNEEAQRLQQYLGLISGGLQFSQSGQKYPGQAGPSQGDQIGAGVGAAASLASAIAMMYMASDRRLKTDVRRIGIGVRGLPLYRFRYTFAPGEHIGHMADEVELIAPHAVKNINGFKYVNYGAL